MSEIVRTFGDRDAELIAETSGALSATATSHRLTKSDATEPTLGLSPAAMRRTVPRMNGSAAVRYYRRENNTVMLIVTPAQIAFSITGTPRWMQSPFELLPKKRRP